MEPKFNSLCDIQAGGALSTGPHQPARSSKDQQSDTIEVSDTQNNISRSINQDLNKRQSREESESKNTMMTTKRRSKKKPELLGDDEKPHFRIDWRQLSYYHTESSVWQFKWLSGDVESNVDERDDDKVSCSYVSNEEENDNSSEVGKECKTSKTGRRKRGRFILNSLDGHFNSGELSAILGPSGAGKSTFLSTLFGARQEQATGQTRLTWFPSQSKKRRQKQKSVEEETGEDETSGVTPNYERRPLRVAFLPQQDHLLHHLTVYETLLFASRLKNQTLNTNLDQQTSNKNGNNNNNEQDQSASICKKNELTYHVTNVKRVARMLKLTDCLNTRCGKLSGGQYKRVSIGQELLSQPDVIILDEPTSGLDASTCLSTIRTLKTIVSGQLPISIILTIHQPDSDVFRLFDRVYVIAQGGTAIYEGPPSGIMATLAQVGLEPPRESYNAARFIVENAFLSEPANDQAFHLQPHATISNKRSRRATPSGMRRGRGGSNDLSHSSPTINGDADDSCSLMSSLSSSSSGDEDEDDGDSNLDWQSDPNNNNNTLGKLSSALTKSLVSLKDTLSGREIKFPDPASKNNNDNECGPIKKERDTSRSRPLLAQIGGFKTLGGRLIKAEKLALKRDYDCRNDDHDDPNDRNKNKKEQFDGDDCATTDLNRLSILRQLNQIQRSVYLAELSLATPPKFGGPLGKATDSKSDYSSAASTSSRGDNGGAAAVVLELGSPSSDGTQNSIGVNEGGVALLQQTRDFDKRLSAKHSSQHLKSAGVFYQARLLTHRTWLSIVRDPIFFGIQAFMHTTIPILLAMIFGSHQEEGCPRLGSFDLVQFAYSGQHAPTSPLESNGASKSMISDTVSSIRLTVGNVGIIFFEMFVLMFAINCITALVFPADMFVLLKEYRNGWYSMSSYFMGRSLADLPIPVLLHSLAIIILCLLTKQPLDFWRLSLIILLVIMASLIAQSVGLTVGAILMRNSQSAVLAAAGIVAPFFALSGFIVRIHTLPWAAQLAAKASYLHQLLNGFIILRYGFNRCPCKEEDFYLDPGHQVPKQLRTMASIWVGTFSDEFSNATHTNANKQLVDPNIDVVDKIMDSFKIANTFGHQMSSCNDVRPYAMLDFNLEDSDLITAFLVIFSMIILSRLITFGAIYYKVRSAT